MRGRIASLKFLVDKLGAEVELIAQELPNSNLSTESQEVVLENIASLNMMIGDARESIQSSLICCDDENLDLNIMEVKYINKALKQSKGHQANAAKLLGIAERTMIRKVADFNIDRSQYKEESDKMACIDK